MPGIITPSSNGSQTRVELTLTDFSNYVNDRSLSFTGEGVVYTVTPVSSVPPGYNISPEASLVMGDCLIVAYMQAVSDAESSAAQAQTH